jgi:hypothetical protein
MTTVAYGCLPFDRQWPEYTPPWYPSPEPNPFNPEPVNAKTPEHRISELELRCSILENRLADLEARPEVSKTELNYTTLHKIKQMIDAIVIKMRRKTHYVDEY